MSAPLASAHEGRWRALTWLAIGDVSLLVSGFALVLSPLLLAIFLPSWGWLALLALPSVSWVFYGLAILRAYAVPRPATSDGILLDPGKTPALAVELERLRHACDAPAFTAVYINAELNAAIYQTGARAGQTQHILVLGLPLLALLTTEQAAAVITHEYAHISRLHGHFARWTYIARQRWAALGELHGRNHRLITAPLRLFLSWYVPRMLRETLEFSRRCEVVADAQAVEVCGPAVAFEAEVALALRQRALSSGYWPAVFAQAGNADIAQAQPYAQLLTEPFNSRPRDYPQAAVWLHESLCQKPDPHSTHPVLSERVAATGVDPTARLPEHLPWHREEASAAEDWLGGQVHSIAAQLDADWRKKATQGWEDAKGWHAYQHGEFSRLMQRRRQQMFDNQDWLQLAELAGTFDQTDALRAEAIVQGLLHSPDDLALLQLKADDLEQSGDIAEAIVIWHRIRQDAPSLAYQAHRRLCELYLRTGNQTEAERHRHIADKLWSSEETEQPKAGGPFPHGMDASELTLLQGTLQPLFQHARAIWLCRETPPGTANPGRWFLYVQAYDGWFLRLVGRLTGDKDFNASASRRVLERLRPRLHIYLEVCFIGPNDAIPAHCTHDSLIARTGSAILPVVDEY
jgi:Zn-dependent protease with chaperone function